MDIDILLYDDLVIDSPSLTIPHPLMPERLFVLEPLCEIMPHRRHPVTGRSISEMIADLRERTARGGEAPQLREVKA